MAGVSLKQVVKSYGQVEAIHGIDLDVVDGEFLVLVGPSGCGKSTLLRMIAGLEEITDGTISIGERLVNDVPASQRNLSMVFQSYALYPHMSVRKNLAFGLTNLKMPKDEIERRVADAAKILQIGELMDRKPRQLSGGQKQRVAIGRAIVREPALFLFDEPLSNLDAELRVQMRCRTCRALQPSRHDDDLCDPRPGRGNDHGDAHCGVVGRQSRTARHAGRTLHPSAEHFCRHLHRLAEDEHDHRHGGQGRHRHSGLRHARHPGLRSSGAISVGVRPEQFYVGEGGDVSASGKVTLVEYLGSEVFVHVALSSGANMMVKAPGHSTHKVGEELTLGITAREAHYFGRTACGCLTSTRIDTATKRAGLRKGREPRMLRFAVVGIDHGHIFHHVDGLLGEGAEFVGYCDRTTVPDLLEAFREKYPDVPALDRDAIFADDSIDVICTAAVPRERAGIGIRAMKAGKDVMLDKPGVTTFQQLEEVKRTVAETGRIFSVCFSERLNVPSAVKAGRLIAEGAIGNVIQTIGLGPHRKSPASRPDWFYKFDEFGGIIVDIASHQIDQFLFYTGSKTAEVVASSVGNFAAAETPEFQDFGEVLLRSDHASGYVRVDWFTPDGLPTWGDGAPDHSRHQGLYRVAQICRHCRA